MNPSPPFRGPRCPPAQLLEELALGEPRSPELAQHLPGCAGCRGYVETLRAGQDAFLKERPAELFLRKVARLERPPRRPLWQLVLAGAPVLAVVLVLPRLLPLESDPPAGVTLKGGSFAVVYKREGMSEPLPVAPDLRLRAGDALRFAYAAPGDGYLLILDVDSAGKVSVFHPYGASRAGPIEGGPRVMLPGSVVLDAAPGPEWLVAVFSSSSLEVEPLAQQLRQVRLGTEELTLRCGDCRVETLRVQKQP